MKKIVTLLAAGLLSVGAMAADIEAGKAKATTCAGCHGADGISVIPTYPNLAGQKSAYLVSALKAYKAQDRKGGQTAIMYGMVAALTEADMENLAAYFESLGQ